MEEVSETHRRQDGSATPAEAPTLWSTLREALQGSQQDLTAIPVSRAAVLLAVPTILEMSMESVLTIVDICFVSRLVSAAIATVGLTESMEARENNSPLRQPTRTARPHRHVR